MRVRIKNVNLEGSRRARGPEPKCCTLSIANVSKSLIFQWKSQHFEVINAHFHWFSILSSIHASLMLSMLEIRRWRELLGKIFFIYNLFTNVRFRRLGAPGGLDESDASFVDTRCKWEFNSRIGREGGEGGGNRRHPLVNKKTGSICTTTTTTITTTGGRISLLDQCVCVMLACVCVLVCGGLWH